MAEPTNPPPRRRRAAVYIGPVDDRHDAGLAEFFQASWGQESDAARVAAWRASEAAENPAEPGVEPPKWVFTRDDRVLGYLGTIPARFVDHGDAFTAYWLKGFWVDPDFRSGPVGFELLRNAIESLGATAVSTVAPEARRLFEAQGITERGVLSNRLKLLDPGRILTLVDPGVMAGIPGVVRTGIRALQKTRTTGLAGAVLSAGFGIAASFRGRSPAGLRITQGWDTLTPEALDGLWDTFRTTVGGAAVRDGTFVHWRYGDPELYHGIGVWEGDTLRGWSALRTPSRATEGRLEGLAVASLSDLLFPIDRADVGVALVAATERLAGRLDADAVLCSGSHPALTDVLGRRAFLPLPGNVHFMAYDADARRFPSPFESWWLTRGDAQSDGAF